MTAYESKHGVCRCTTDEDGTQRIVLMDTDCAGLPTIRYIVHNGTTGATAQMAVGFIDKGGESAEDLQAKAFMDSDFHGTILDHLSQTLADATAKGGKR